MERDVLYASYGDQGDVQEFVRLAQALESQGQLEAAATAYDRAYALAPMEIAIAAPRQKLLNQLVVVDYGIPFRYIPAGTFLMGSANGDPDERPVHPVSVDTFWLSETCVSWAKFCELMDLQAPPSGMPDEDWKNRQPPGWMKTTRGLVPKEGRRYDFWTHYLTGDYRVCLQYCENETMAARDWHAHLPAFKMRQGTPTQIRAGTAEEVNSHEVFGQPPSDNAERPWGYDEKPMVTVSYVGATALGLRLSNAEVQYRLPTEAEWEKAARGGLVNATYAWGNHHPDANICDFGRFAEFSIRKMKALPPNEYGLYAMCGSVWEWTADWYDAEYYEQGTLSNPTGPKTGTEHVLRGGSWADDAEAVTVSYRMSQAQVNAANVGFRLCRVVSIHVEGQR